jgi:hypothetical protein
MALTTGSCHHSSTWGSLLGSVTGPERVCTNQIVNMISQKKEREYSALMTAQWTTSWINDLDPMHLGTVAIVL